MDELTKEECVTIKRALAYIGCENLIGDVDFNEILGTPYMDFFKYMPTAMQVLSKTETKDVRRFTESLKGACIILSSLQRMRRSYLTLNVCAASCLRQNKINYSYVKSNFKGLSS